MPSLVRDLTPPVRWLLCVPMALGKTFRPPSSAFWGLRDGTGGGKQGPEGSYPGEELLLRDFYRQGHCMCR